LFTKMTSPLLIENLSINDTKSVTCTTNSTHKSVWS